MENQEIQTKFCKHCGAEIDDGVLFCPKCGKNLSDEGNTCAPQYDQPIAKQKDKLVAGLLAIFLGAFGIHKFYLGYSKPGIIMLLVSLLTFGIGASVMAIIGIIEGIIYLTKTEQEFFNIYEQSSKEWF